MLGAVVILAVAFLGGTLPTPLYAIYQKSQGFSHVVLTLIYGAYVIGTLAVLLGLGRVSDQLGRRRTVYAGLAVGALATAIFVVFPDRTAALYAGRVASGVSVGLVTGAATAWIAELHPHGDRGAASLWAAVGNVGGIGLGPFLSGVLADVAPWPLRLPYLIFGAITILAVLVAAGTRETVARPAAIRDLELRPRLGVPRSIWSRFLPPTLGAVSIFAVFGFYSAIEPSFLGRELQQPSHALAGGIVLELCAFAIAAMLVTRRLESRTAMLGGLAVLIPGVGLIIVAELVRSLPVFIAATALAGLGFGPGYRGSLEVVNHIAPPERRAEVLSSYFVFCYLGLSVPIVGIGILSGLASPPVANAIFAATVGVMAMTALLLGARTLPRG